MPSEKKKCGACKDKLTREGYAKEQWQKEENERRCLACVAADRPNTAAQTPEEKAERVSSDLRRQQGDLRGGAMPALSSHASRRVGLQTSLNLLCFHGTL